MYIDVYTCIFTRTKVDSIPEDGHLKLTSNLHM